MFALRALDPLCTHEFLDVCASCINCLIVVFAAYIRFFFFLMAEDEGDYVQEFSLLESTGQRVVLKVYVYVFFF